MLGDNRLLGIICVWVNGIPGEISIRNKDARLSSCFPVPLAYCGATPGEDDGAKIGIQVAQYLTNKHSGCDGWLCMTLS